MDNHCYYLFIILLFLLYYIVLNYFNNIKIGGRSSQAD